MAYRLPDEPAAQWPVASLMGRFASPLVRFRVPLAAAGGVLLLVYVLAVVLLVPREVWRWGNPSSGSSPMGFLLVATPFALGGTLLLAWMRSRGRTVVYGATLRAHDGVLTLDVPGRVPTRVTIHDVEPGAWYEQGAPAGPLLRVRGPDEALCVAAASPPLSRRGVQATPDVLVDIDDLGLLARHLGLDW